MSTNLKFITVESDKQIQIVEDLGKEIWTEHYTPIIGTKQVDYMLDKFQSNQAISDQIKNRYSYFLINNASKNIGYFSIEVRNDKLFLSKIYLLKNQRGKGYFSHALTFIEKSAISNNLTGIELTVNKYNENSIAVYVSKGFKIMKSQVFDIGNGFVMDDYVLLKSL